jgi:RHS repeat-associated protein
MISRTLNGIKKLFHHQGGDVIAEELPSGEVSARYTLAGGIISLHNSDTPHFYHPNAIGSIETVTDADGNIEATYEMDAYGNLLSSTDTLDNDFRFIGAHGVRYDATTGLCYMRARWYDPETGRFISRDPYKGDITRPDSLHHYLYCRNNPIKFTDPSGRLAPFWHETVTWQAAMEVGGFTIKELHDLSTASMATDFIFSFPLSSVHHGFLEGQPDDPVKLKKYVDRLAENYLNQAVEAAHSGNWNKAAGLLGLGIHALQDVSNWRSNKRTWDGSNVDLFPTPADRQRAINSTRKYLRKFKQRLQEKKSCSKKHSSMFFVPSLFYTFYFPLAAV